MLAMLGHSVLETADGESALQMLHSSPVDVLVADISLPGMGGDELAALARRRWPQLRIVFATGYDSISAASSTAASPDGMLVRKPYDINVLMAAIEATRAWPPSTAPA